MGFDVTNVQQSYIDAYRANGQATRTSLDENGNLVSYHLFEKENGTYEWQAALAGDFFQKNDNGDYDRSIEGDIHIAGRTDNLEIHAQNEKVHIDDSNMTVHGDGNHIKGDNNEASISGAGNQMAMEGTNIALNALDGAFGIMKATGGISRGYAEGTGSVVSQITDSEDVINIGGATDGGALRQTGPANIGAAEKGAQVYQDAQSEGINIGVALDENTTLTQSNSILNFAEVYNQAFADQNGTLNAALTAGEGTRVNQEGDINLSIVADGSFSQQDADIFNMAFLEGENTLAGQDGLANLLTTIGGAAGSQNEDAENLHVNNMEDLMKLLFEGDGQSTPGISPDIIDNLWGDGDVEPSNQTEPQSNSTENQEISSARISYNNPFA